LLCSCRGCCTLIINIIVFTKQKKLSEKEKNKLNYEIHKIYDYIFKVCKHFKVSCFGVEDLSKITNSPIKERGRTFNRSTHNMWCRDMQVIAIKNRCSTYGIKCNEVAAHYSSFIGNIKHEIYDCCASSVEISRRAYLKYKKCESFLYPCITKEDVERLIHLYGQDLVVSKTWVYYYDKFKTKNSGCYGGWWRNKKFTVDKNLNCYKSNVIICT